MNVSVIMMIIISRFYLCFSHFLVTGKTSLFVELFTNFTQTYYIFTEKNVSICLVFIKLLFIMCIVGISDAAILCSSFKCIHILSVNKQAYANSGECVIMCCL